MAWQNRKRDVDEEHAEIARRYRVRMNEKNEFKATYSVLSPHST
jgi:hypothetical protein